MKVETPNFIFSTSPDAGNAAVNILCKPVKGSPYVSLSISTLEDAIALQTILNQTLPPVQPK